MEYTISYYSTYRKKIIIIKARVFTACAWYLNERTPIYIKNNENAPNAALIIP